MRKRVGEFLIERGCITQAQVAQILKHSEVTGLRFGDAALDLGLLTRDQLIEVFGPSFKVDFFHLDPKYFPEVTRALLPVEAMIRWGVLPLGFKTERGLLRSRRVLNLGQLDPSRSDAAEEARRCAQAKLGAEEIQGVKVFLVMADHFLAVLNEVYGVTDEQLRALEAGHVDERLAMYVDKAQ